jgi:long-chain acyl-CoA synthetase
MHRATADRLGRRVALRSKRYGLYRDITWESYRRRADGAAAAMVARGIGPGDRVGILAENSATWLTADIAILSTGAADVPMHAPLAPRQVAYQLGHSGARACFVADQRQADKVIAVLDVLPALEWLIGFEPIEAPDRVRVTSWEALVHDGRGLGSDGLHDVLLRERAVQREDLATIIYTSGTTGDPRGVMLSHGNVLSNAESVLMMGNARPDDILLSWLPYSHIYARTVDHYLTALAGTVLCLAESVDTLTVNLAETQPTWMTSVPRFYEKVWAAVAPLPPQERAARLKAIFGPRIRWLSSGGAPLPRHVAEEYHEAGLLLLQGYGLTETSPVISFNRIDRYKLETVGLPLPGVEVAIADDGEVLTRGPHVMLGYWNDPEATRAATGGGWLHTGDVGRLDADGFLTITDRKKDLIITSGGKNIAPAMLEQLMAGDPYIEQAVAYGDGRPFVTALIVPDLPRLREAARRLGRPEPGVAEFVTDEALVGFMAERVARVMEAVSQPERVRSFVLLGHPLRADADELTATLKVRRRFLLEKYKAHLDALYSNPTGPRPGLES